jgi:polyisoprenoid-binding protein YceI
MARLVPPLVVLGLGSPAAADAVRYRVDPARSALIVHVARAGVAARLAHDHAVEATEIAGTVRFDPAAPESAAVTVEVPTAALRVDDPAARRRLGLDGDLSASQRAEVTRAMRAPDQLDAARFPTIRFVSTRVERERDGEYRVAGALTIRDVTREVRFPARVAFDGATLVGRATLAFLQSSFGYRPYRALLGAIQNRDEVTLHVELVAHPE